MSLPVDQMSQHPVRQVQVRENFTYTYIEKGTGPVIVLLHGFPDLANTWDESIADLSQEYRCIAPFLRGYYPTDIPDNGDYRVKTIAEDIGLLMEKLDVDHYFLVGQDWGASIAYAVANLYPKAVTKLVTIAIPHPRYLKVTIPLISKARHFIRFRNPSSSLNYTRRNNFDYIDRLFRRWSPNWTDYTPTAVQVKATFAMPGRLEAALGYYWDLVKSINDRELQAFYAQKPQMPLLAFAGKTDGALSLSPYTYMKASMGDDVKIVIDEVAGHFLHREIPEKFLKELKAFIKS